MAIARIATVLLALAALAAPATASASISTADFSGSGLAYDFSGTFTLDHFEVRAPAAINLDGLSVPPGAPRVVAAGTVTGSKTFAFGGVVTFTDAPFTWVRVSVSGSCSGIDVQLAKLDGSEYVGLHGEVYFPDLPFSPWGGPFRQWGILEAGAIHIIGNTGLMCASARLSAADAPPQALATVLNRLLATA